MDSGGNPTATDRGPGHILLPGPYNRGTCNPGIRHQHPEAGTGNPGPQQGVQSGGAQANRGTQKDMALSKP